LAPAIDEVGPEAGLGVDENEDVPGVDETQVFTVPVADLAPDSVEAPAQGDPLDAAPEARDLATRGAEEQPDDSEPDVPAAEVSDDEDPGGDDFQAWLERNSL